MSAAENSTETSVRITPRSEGTLNTSDGHSLYYAEYGNSCGIPVAIIHGGPGAAPSNHAVRLFNADAFRVIVAHQRGVGRSRPHASLKNNTTWHLVGDMETLREHLGIDRWMLFGGSWGAALSLAYAEKYPARVDCMLLRNVFLLRRQELEWFYQQGASLVFPDAWTEFIEIVPEDERGDIISAYGRLLNGSDKTKLHRAARRWTEWERRTSFLVPNATDCGSAPSNDYCLAMARIENHYFVNRGFFYSDNQLLRDATRLAEIPGWIVHGRYDMVCPVKNAFDLHYAWPRSELVVVDNAGHSGNEQGIRSELLRIINNMIIADPIPRKPEQRRSTIAARHSQSRRPTKQ